MPAFRLQPLALLILFKDVQPILAKHCYECHGEKKQRAELRWDVKAIALKGGEHGPAIVPGKSAESLDDSTCGRIKRSRVPHAAERRAVER